MARPRRQETPGDRLKALRRDLGYSIREAARQTGLSSHTVWAWETGRQKVPDGGPRLRHVAEVYRTTVVYLLEGDPE